MVRKIKISIIILACTSLSGCLTVAAKRDFPKVPEELTKECGDLKTLNSEDPKLSDLMKTVRENYTKYHRCSIQVEAWKEWYEEQKKIQDSLK